MLSNMRMAGNQDPSRSDLVRNLDSAFKSSSLIRVAALNRQSVATVLGRASRACLWPNLKGQLSSRTIFLEQRLCFQCHKFRNSNLARTLEHPGDVQ
jgi:hypothetical protein